ncbi:MAG: bifunctional SulP family inorganic anion transporter/carbonic anhydrase [Labilithrix sp.]|nr:bifunctional SulP family inorganic anion transporter/carbonic anhydrase [Labilithrix sp.]
MPRLDLRLDLGVRRLLPAWRSLFSREHIRDDLVAGLTVACVAIPLSLAIALASGVAPVVGLITAILAGVVCALFGGTRLAVSGPAAAMAVLVATIVQELGFAALLVVAVGCGLLQIVTGVLGLGRFIRLVPLPVIEGFTAGIGAIILIGQLPRALGLPAPEQSHVFDVVTHIFDLLPQTRPAAVVVTLGSLAIIYGLPRLSRRIPPHLAAVIVATVAVAALGLQTDTIGALPKSLPTPRLPDWPAGVSIVALAGATVVVYALASLETLLSTTAVDKMAREHKSDPDQELIGQGLGNLTVAAFGGIPVTGVIARSATNVQAGAKTRRSSIIHAIALLLATLVAASVIALIPIASLAAVLFSVAFRMLNPRTFSRLWKHSRADGVVFAVTFAVIVFVDLLKGVQWGIAAALVVAAIQLGRTRMVVRGARTGDSYVLDLEGPLTFMSSLDIERLGHDIALLEPGRGVIIDVGGVTLMDASGAEMLWDVVTQAKARELRPVVVGLTDDQRAMLSAASGEDVSSIAAASEREAAALLGAELSPDATLRAGVDRYRTTTRPHYAQLFEHLATGQAPHTLFITCSDSRIIPDLFTDTEPGELFIVRDVGNLVPRAAVSLGSSVGAAIEYAVDVLSVRKIVVCGHSGCGAIKALLMENGASERHPNIDAWLDVTEARAGIAALPSSLSADEVARMNVLLQVDHVRSYDVVIDAIAEGRLSVAAWFFDVGEGEVEEWSAEAQRFVPLAGEPSSERSAARAKSRRRRDAARGGH